MTLASTAEPISSAQEREQAPALRVDVRRGQMIMDGVFGSGFHQLSPFLQVRTTSVWLASIVALQYRFEISAEYPLHPGTSHASGA